MKINRKIIKTVLCWGKCRKYRGSASGGNPDPMLDLILYFSRIESSLYTKRIYNTAIEQTVRWNNDFTTIKYYIYNGALLNTN